MSAKQRVFEDKEILENRLSFYAKQIKELKDHEKLLLKHKNDRDQAIMSITKMEERREKQIQDLKEQVNQLKADIKELKEKLFDSNQQILGMVSSIFNHLAEAKGQKYVGKISS